jgi:hypothetical protein
MGAGATGCAAGLTATAGCTTIVGVAGTSGTDDSVVSPPHATTQQATHDIVSHRFIVLSFFVSG